MKRALSAALLSVVLTALGAVAPASAHKPSDSYLSLHIDGGAITGQWDIALRDLDFVLGLDANQDGAITWGEVKAKHAAIAAYALSRLTLGPAGAPCAATAREQLIDDHSDGAYAVLRFDVACPAAVRALAVEYRLFAEIDAQHRGLLKLTSDGTTRAAILGAGTATQTFTLVQPSRVAQFVEYAREGVLHIWAGFDHILFLLSLLLPAVLLRAPPGGQTWVSVPDFRSAFWNVFTVVTAFTVAHSITLSLAALGMVTLPSRLVESAIAASVLLAALNNVWPVVVGRRWAIAFLFGLIHGFGFASVLADLGLPQDALLLSLVAFNVGVELGQLAIVVVFLPVAYALRETRFYRSFVMVGGSVVVALIALAWLVERALNFALLPQFGT
jgi:HupE / UreJ protein